MTTSWQVAWAAGTAALLLLAVPLPTGPPSAGGNGSEIGLEAVPLPSSTPLPYATGMSASLALGTPNLTGGYQGPPTNATDFVSYPEDAFADPSGNVWVTDWGGSRVLEFRAPIRTGEPASLVLGQGTMRGNASGTSPTNLSNPSAATMDARGDLWVADWGNQRILEFVPPFHDGQAASLVLGQSNFTTSSPGATARTLDDPVGLSFDANGDLWVADRLNSRVLAFQPPFHDGMAASLVVGQSTFVASGAGTSATNLSYPIAVDATGSTLWVADESNNRVVGFPAPWTTGESATYLLGQPTFASSAASGATSLSAPLSVAVDGQGTLWVSDSGHNRVAGFRPPFSTQEAPTVVVGQSSLAGVAGGQNATNLSTPFGAAVGPNGTLWVSDAGNDRVLGFVPTTYPVTVSERGLPAGTAWSAEVGNESEAGVGPLTFHAPNGTHALYVRASAGYGANPSYSTVTVVGGEAAVTVSFAPVAPDPFSDGVPATQVLGQPTFFRGRAPAPTDLNASDFGGGTSAAAFDASGDLWVADAEANRVLEFVPPFHDGMAASVVLGQPSFGAAAPGSGPAGLSDPEGLAFDRQGDLWVSDAGNDRLLAFAPPFTSGMSAVAVLGQPNFSTHGASTSARSLSDPAGITFGGGSLWVADAGNNRVVGFPAPLSTGEAATAVLGQSNLSLGSAGLGPANLSSPDGVAVGANGSLWVADRGNDRVVEYPAPIRSGEAATVALGQASLSTSGAEGPASFGEPAGVAVDARGNLWVADGARNRTLEFPGPQFTTGEPAAVALGQGNTSTSGGSIGPSGEDDPLAVVAGPNGSLWVSDAGNDRVLEYAPTNFSLALSVSGLPTGLAWSASVGGVLRSGLLGNSTAWSVTNGTYPWSVAPLPGYTLAPLSGVATVNGANTTVAVTAEPFTFPVAFTAKGLPPATTWSVTVDGLREGATGPGPVVFLEANGSHAFSVAAPAGYLAASNATGLLEVHGGPSAVVVTFATAPSGGGGVSGLELVALLLGIAVAAAVAALLVRRGRRAKPPSPPGPPVGASTTPGAGRPPAEEPPRPPVSGPIAPAES